MRASLIAIVAALTTGCAFHAAVEHPIVDPSSIAAGCGDAPAIARGHFRHFGSKVTTGLGSPRHRGVDLIASTADETQTLGGKFAYGAVDADLEEETIAISACVDHGWRTIGEATTDEHGRFALTLAGDHRLPAGMRDLYATAIGDGTGVRFVAYVAAPGTRVIVSDVDGTLTRSEHAMVSTVLWGSDIGNQPGAPNALAASGYQVIYVTGRGDQYTEVTRRWLALHGFPRGPLRLAPSTTMAAGAPTIEYKAAALVGLHLPIAAAIGNRASDITAYGRAGVAPGRIFIHLPEFTNEVRDPIAQHLATGFTDYGALDGMLSSGR
jgi:phosphatidate phosphatase PAH1